MILDSHGFIMIDATPVQWLQVLIAICLNLTYFMNKIVQFKYLVYVCDVYIC